MDQGRRARSSAVSRRLRSRRIPSRKTFRRKLGSTSRKFVGNAVTSRFGRRSVTRRARARYRGSVSSWSTTTRRSMSESGTWSPRAREPNMTTAVGRIPLRARSTKCSKNRRSSASQSVELGFNLIEHLPRAAGGLPVLLSPVEPARSQRLELPKAHGEIWQVGLLEEMRQPFVRVVVAAAPPVRDAGEELHGGGEAGLDDRLVVLLMVELG